MRVQPVSLAASAVNRPNQLTPTDQIQSQFNSHTQTHRKQHTHFKPNIQATPFTHKQSNALSQTHTNSRIHSHSKSHYNTTNSPNSAFQYCVCRIHYQAHFSNRFDREMHQVHPEHCIYSHDLKRKLDHSLLILRIDPIASPNEKRERKLPEPLTLTKLASQFSQVNATENGSDRLQYTFPTLT